MGYAIMIGQCCACKQTVHFNPHKVPSLMIDGKRMELCRKCAERWNELHPDLARPILPGAYDPLREEEL